jgi:hypothetical protein
METNERFETLKSEILRRAKEAKACEGEYARAYGAETVSGLMRVIKDNFSFACEKGSNRQRVDGTVRKRVFGKTRFIVMCLPIKAACLSATMRLLKNVGTVSV